MGALIQSVSRFLNNMDKRALTSISIMAALMLFVVLMVAFGADLFGLDQNTVSNVMERISNSPFSLIGVIFLFCALALTGFPQTLLFAGTVAVFGGELGALYSWISTMFSSTMTFYLGRYTGGNFVKKLSAGRAASMIEVVRNHGIIASMFVRVTPSAPFIVVNAICGAAHIPVWKFWLGTGIGIIPKILVIALFTEQLDKLLSFFKTRDPRDLVMIIVIIVVWLAFLVFVRWLYMRLRKNSLKGMDPEE